MTDLFAMLRSTGVGTALIVGGFLLAFAPAEAAPFSGTAASSNAAKAAITLTRSARPPGRTFFRMPWRHRNTPEKTCGKHYVWNGKACVKAKG